MTKKIKNNKDACPFPPDGTPPTKTPVTKIIDNLETLGANWKYLVTTMMVIAAGLLYYNSLLVTPIPIFNVPNTWNQTLPNYTYPENEILNWTPKYNKQIIMDKDIHLTNNETLIIENCTYILKGVLVAEGNSKVLLRNAELFVEKKNSWSTPGDITRSGLYLEFKDNASFSVVDSKLVYLDHVASIGFFDTSKGIINSSNLSCFSLECGNRASLDVYNSIIASIYVSQNSVIDAHSSIIDSLGPKQTGAQDFENSLGTVAYIENTTIRQLTLLLNNANIHLTKPFPSHFDSFNVEEDLCGDCEAFWVTMENSEVDGISLYAYNSEVWLENQYLQLLIVSGKLDMVNSTCYGLFGYGVFNVSDSVVNLYNLDYNSTHYVSGSRIGRIHLHSFYGSCFFDTVQIDFLEGHDSKGTLSGSIVILDKAIERYWHNSVRLERVYTVLVSKDGHYLRGAELRLIDDNGSVVWSDSTEYDDVSSFSLTFYNGVLLDYNYLNNMTGSYTFEAEYGGVVKSLQVNLVTDTPIIFDFSDT